MSAFSERRSQDIQKLSDLSIQSGKRILVTSVSGNPPSEVEVELHLKTAPSKQYPSSIQNVTRVVITLPSRYPFQEPTAIIKTPIFHPNVYSTGRICFGAKWLPSQGLDLLVKRVAQIITFDPAILNEKSPANGEALKWYREAYRKHVGAFPTDALNLADTSSSKKMSWSNVSSGMEAKSIIECPSCRGKISLPKGKRGKVRCPKCSKVFEAET